MSNEAGLAEAREARLRRSTSLVGPRLPESERAAMRQIIEQAEAAGMLVLPLGRYGTISISPLADTESGTSAVQAEAKPPECPLELPVSSEDEFLVDARGETFGCCDSREQASFLAWVINSHIEVGQLQDRLQNLVAERNLQLAYGPQCGPGDACDDRVRTGRCQLAALPGDPRYAPAASQEADRKAAEIASALFAVGVDGEKAVRLVLAQGDAHAPTAELSPVAGWCEQSVRDLIREHL